MDDAIHAQCVPLQWWEDKEAEMAALLRVAEAAEVLEQWADDALDRIENRGAAPLWTIGTMCWALRKVRDDLSDSLAEWRRVREGEA